MSMVFMIPKAYTPDGTPRSPDVYAP
jgi:hypothetical protein